MNRKREETEERHPRKAGTLTPAGRIWPGIQSRCDHDALVSSATLEAYQLVVSGGENSLPGRAECRAIRMHPAETEMVYRRPSSGIEEIFCKSRQQKKRHLLRKVGAYRAEATGLEPATGRAGDGFQIRSLTNSARLPIRPAG